MSIEYTWSVKSVFLETKGSTEPTITQVTKEVEIEVPGYPDQVPILDEEGNPTGEFETVENPHTIKKEVVETKTEGSEEVELEKFVQSINVRITGTKGSDTSYIDTTAHLYHNPNNSYTAYDNLTEDQLITWAKAGLGSGVIESLENQIEREITPENIVSGYVPWGNND